MVSSCQNAANASGVAGSGTQRVPPQRESASGSPVSMYVLPSTMSSSCATRAPGAGWLPVKSVTSPSRPRRRASSMSMAMPSALIGRAIGRIASGPGKIMSMATLPSSRTPSATVSIASHENVLRGGSAWLYQARR
jgi:hypothetical protein